MASSHVISADSEDLIVITTVEVITVSYYDKNEMKAIYGQASQLDYDLNPSLSFATDTRQCGPKNKMPEDDVIVKKACIRNTLL